MAKTPAPKPSSEDESQLVGAAFDSARGLTSALGAFADCARADRRAPMPVGWWKRWGPQYASGFFAWHALSHFYLSPAVRRRVKSAYPLSADPVRLGKARPAATVIEAIADELGVAFRNLLFQDRASPLDPPPGTVANSGWAAHTLSGDGAVDRMLIREKIDDWNRRGIRNWGDAYAAIVSAWDEQTDELAEERLAVLKFRGVDFEDLLVRLEREALACCPAPQGAHNAISSALDGLAADGESLRENPSFNDGGTPMHAEKAAMCVRAAVEAGHFAHPRYQLLRAELSTYREGVAQWVVAVEWLREPTTPLPIPVVPRPEGHDSLTYCFPEDARAFAMLVQHQAKSAVSTSGAADSPPGAAELLPHSQLVEAIEDAPLAPSSLLKLFGLPEDRLNAVNKRLQRFRRDNHDGWVQISDAGSQEAQFLYKVWAVRPFFEEMRAASDTTSKWPAP